MHELMQHQRSVHRKAGGPDDLGSARVRIADGGVFADSWPGGAQLAIICSRRARGIRCNELTTLPFKIDRLLDDPERLAAMSRAATAMGTAARRAHCGRRRSWTIICRRSRSPAKQMEAIAQAASRERALMSEVFLWGVATSAYQAEGGYNGPGQPQTNWAAAEERGDVAQTGKAADFWNRYDGGFRALPFTGLTLFVWAWSGAGFSPRSMD